MRRQPPPDPFWSHTTTQPRHHAAGSRWLCWRVLGPSQTPRLTGSPVARPRATTAPGGRRGGGGKTLPAWTPGQAYASQSGAGRILGSGEQGDSRETSPRVTRVPKPLPQLGNQSWDHPANPRRRGRRQGGEERRGSRGLPLGRRHPGRGKGRATGSPVPSATGPPIPLPAVRPPSSGRVPLPGERLGLPELSETRS